MEKLPKPSGWKKPFKENGIFYTKVSAYGQKYKCIYCGREQLGISGEVKRMHWKDCEWLISYLEKELDTIKKKS